MKRPLLTLGLVLALLLVLLLSGVFWMLSRAVAADVPAESAYIDLVLRDRALHFSEMLRSRYADEINSQPPLADISHWIARGFAPLNPDVFLLAWNRNGQLIGHTLNIAQPLPLSSTACAAITNALAEDVARHVVELRTLPDGRAVKVTTYPLYEDDKPGIKKVLVGYVAAGLPVPELSRRLTRAAWVLAATALAVLALTVTSTAWMLRKARRAAETEEVRQRKQIADFVADAAHELSTPLTVLRGEIELALRRDRLAEDYRVALGVCREETEHLERLAAHLLQLASADAGQSLLARKETDLAPLCAEIADRWQAQAAERGLTLQCETPKSLCLSADAVALERILHNLLDNAFRHTPRGGSVALSLSTRDQEAVLRVSDTGEGIAAMHLPKIFHRFYRVDKARSRARGGAGLGLAIVKALVEAHGGSITVASEPGNGTTFEMVFPVG